MIRMGTVPALIALLTAAVSLSGCVATIRSGSPEPEPEIVEVEYEDRVVIEDYEDRGPLGVPPGHLPPPGLCRVWFPGYPPGRQPRPEPCARAEATAPPDSWILYTPPEDRRLVHVRIIDPERTGIVVQVRVYDANRGTYLGTREGRPRRRPGR